MLRWIYACAASAALLAAGLVHGFWTDRWAASADVTEAADRLGSIPSEIGDWHGTPIPVKAGAAGPGVAGCVQRTFVNNKTGATVVLAMVNGRPGPVSIHTPESCYGASGYKVERRVGVPLDTAAGPAQFWRADAVKTKVTDESRLRIYWAWNGGAGWTAPDDARQTFPRHRVSVLHKLYVLRDLNASSAVSKTQEPCEAFIADLLPVLQRQLFVATTPGV